MTDEEFFAFLDACRAELKTKQALFIDRNQHGTDWFYDLKALILRIGNQQYEIVPVGTHSKQYQTWLWAWANEDFPAAARAASAKLKELYEPTKFRMFVDDGIEADSLDAQDFTAMAVHHLDAMGFYRIPEDEGPTLYLAVLKPLPA